MKETIENYEIDSELEAWSSDIQLSPDEYKNRYILVKRAFEKIDFDL